MNKWAKDIKSLALGALLLIVCMQLVVSALLPMVPYLVGGLVLFGIVAFAFNKGSRL
jgi:hypothetical protein